MRLRKPEFETHTWFMAVYNARLLLSFPELKERKETKDLALTLTGNVSEIGITILDTRDLAGLRMADWRRTHLHSFHFRMTDFAHRPSRSNLAANLPNPSRTLQRNRWIQNTEGKLYELVRVHLPYEKLIDKIAGPANCPKMRALQLLVKHL